MIFYQLKAIRKGTKPPIWRRIFVPSNVTFAQMALILETVLETPETDRYEFEFYQKKDRIREWTEEKEPQDFYYSYWYAPHNYVNNWLNQEKWFTFRILEANEETPEYRLEIEKRVTAVRIDGESGDLISYPVIQKEVSLNNDKIWSDPYALNEKLKTQFCLIEGDALYPVFQTLLKDWKKHRCITFSENAENRTEHTRPSSGTYLSLLADKVFDIIAPEDKAELLKDSPVDWNSDVMKIAKQKMEKDVSRMQKSSSGETSAPGRNPSVEGYLKAHSQKDLQEIADGYGCHLQGKRKDKMAYEIARFLLTPQNMKNLFLLVSEEELDAFEAAIGKGCFIPEDDEYENLYPFIENFYICEYQDGHVELAEEAAVLYNVIRKNGYREFHSKATWLIACMECLGLMHAVAPIRILYKMYQRRSDLKMPFEEFEAFIKTVPGEYLSCERVGDRIVWKPYLKNQIYLLIEENQKDLSYYVPTLEEILDYSKEEYPASEDAYRKLHAFFQERLEAESYQSDILCIKAFNLAVSDGTPNDFFDFLESSDIKLQNEEDAKTLIRLLMEAHNHTRMYLLRGHTPEEAQDFCAVSEVPFQPMLVPLHSNPAGVMVEGKRKQNARDVSADPGEAAQAKKVYPNDPCPCGSGKKYKKCCGRNK